ncbi:MAG: flagellar hook-basal body complex protein FliE [Candidatus Hydrogenedentes bacterium]|nr:flagellar hook-basal body complex protein FliE [Candidatus Hydrogenedentota bacterium]
MAEPTRIAPISPQRVDIDPRTPRAAVPTNAPAKPFKEVLAESIGEVQRLQTEADTNIKKLVSGQLTDPSEVMVAVEKADVAFQTMMTVRNHIVAAYEEVMRMQV